jgi:hypothetical protein
MYGKKFGVIFVSLVCLVVLSSGASAARPVNLNDFFVVGELGANSQSWNYQYTAGPSDIIGHRFTVTLTGSVDQATGIEHRIYQRQDPITDPETGESSVVISPYLECDVSRQSISIYSDGTREGFNFYDDVVEMPRLRDGELFHISGERYAWYPSFRRGSIWTVDYTEYRSWLLLAIIDTEGFPTFPPNGDALLGLPDEVQDIGRVIGCSKFAKGVGEVEYTEFVYDEYGNYLYRDKEYTLVSPTANP